MHQFETLAVLVEEFYRILAGMSDPEDIHLVTDEVGLRFRHEQIEERPMTVWLGQRTLRVWLKFITVRMIKEPNSLFCENLTCPVKDSGSGAAFLFIEIATVS